MGLRPSLKGRPRTPAKTDLNLTPFIDILVCLILFLLATAIFSKAAILDLYLPTESDEASSSAPPENNERKITPTVAVTHEGFILNLGSGNLMRIPLDEHQEYNFPKLQEHLIHLRQNQAASNNLIILSEGDLTYQTLINTMDTCREYKPADGTSISLFPTISLGEYRASASGTSEGATL